MPTFRETKAAGGRAENQVFDVVSKYTNSVYRNIVVDSVYTSNGRTEIDVIAAIADVIFIFEVKNIRSIEGNYSDNTWTLRGRETGTSYPSLNIFNQNRIHLRSLRNLWAQKSDFVPPLASVVIVPNDCVVPDELARCGILTLHELDEQLLEMVRDYGIGNRPAWNYNLDYLMSGSNCRLRRNDFA